MLVRLREKVAIVTGAGRGIGKGIALRFAEEGAMLVLNDVNKDDVKRTNDEIVGRGGKAVFVVGSVASRETAQKLVDTAVKHFGTVDILVNNAGITRDAMLHKMTDDQWDDVVNVNLKGVFLCTQCTAIVMRMKKYGKIVNISSVSWKGNPGQLNYSATKAGVIGITKTAAKELASKGINVNAIAPGMIWTDMLKTMPPDIIEKFVVPLDRKGTPNDIANLALFLASDESSFITGQLIHCDGGLVL
jgi:3-oxoacyl-[acyl-carrier protein] reductase